MRRRTVAASLRDQPAEQSTVECHQFLAQLVDLLEQ
jgi:hypothetical protein